MATRIGGIALFFVLGIGLVLGSRTLSSPQATLGFVASDSKVVYAALVAGFALAGAIAAGSRSALLRGLGGLVLLGCFSFGVMLWSTWNAPASLTEAVDMLDDIDQQFAEVAAALEGVEANLAAPAGGALRIAAQPTIDSLVTSGHVLVGRECELDAFGTGSEQLAYLSADGELVQLTVERLRGERTVILGQSSTTGAAPLLPIEPACR